MSGLANRLQLTDDALRHRVINHTHMAYLNFAYLVKSGVFAVAGLTFIQILAQPDPFRSERIAFWCASFGFSFISIMKWSTGSILTNGRSNPFDSLLPIGMGICEYALFLVLAPDASRSDSLIWHYWYVAMFGHSAFGVGIVLNRYLMCDVPRDYDEKLQDIGKAYKAWMASDLKAAGSMALLPLIIFLSVNTQSAFHWPVTLGGRVTEATFHVFWGGFFTIGAIFVCIRTALDYNKVVTSVS